MVLAPCNTLFLHGLCRSRVPSRDGQRVARGARRHSLRSALHRGPLVAWTGHVHCRRQAASGKRQAASGRRQAIVLTAINLNPVRMDQHPRGAPACFEQALEESLETAPARVHRSNGLARHAAFVRNTCCGPARLLLVDDHNLFRTPEDHTTAVGP